MRLTRYGHSCVRVDDLTGVPGVLVVDPGTFSDTAAALAGATAILVTHEHPDHLDVAAVADALTANPALRIWAPASAAALLDDVATTTDRFTVVEAGAELDVAGFAVRTFGGLHAQIDASLPVVPNIAYLIQDRVLHPGDSFTIPPVDVQVLLVPLHAPWSKVAEVLTYVAAVRAPRNLTIHDALLSAPGLAVTEAHVERVVAAYGLDYRNLASGESLTITDG